MFDVDELIAACVAANQERDRHRAIREVLDRTVADGDAVADALQPREAGITLLHHTPELTVLNIVWAPGMRIFPHDHRMWACIGIYGGQEDNTFYRRSPDGVVPSGGTELQERDVALLGDDTIHAVHNPRNRFTGAIHIYGGDFFTQERSEFDPETFAERPYDPERTMALFEAANSDLA